MIIKKESKDIYNVIK